MHGWPCSVFIHECAAQSPLGGFWTLNVDMNIICNALEHSATEPAGGPVWQLALVFTRWIKKRHHRSSWPTPSPGTPPYLDCCRYLELCEGPSRVSWCKTCLALVVETFTEGEENVACDVTEWWCCNSHTENYKWHVWGEISSPGLGQELII